MPNIAFTNFSATSINYQVLSGVNHSQRMSDLTLLDHIISQTRENVELLMSHNRISQSDGRNILAKLPSSQVAGSIISLTQQTQRLNMSPTPTQGVTGNSANSHTSPLEARAIWEWTSEVYPIRTYVLCICSNHGRIQVIFRSMSEKS